MRAFLAVDLKDKIRKKIVKEALSLKKINADLKLVEEENLHITLKFLGEVSKKQVKKVKEKIKSLAGDFEGFKIKIKGGGVFPSPDYIKVVWVGISKGSKKLKKLNKKIRGNLKGMKIKKDQHEYTPHITIARVRSGKGKGEIMDFVKNLKEKEFGKQKVEKIKLKKSKLTKKGPIYSDIQIFSL